MTAYKFIDHTYDVLVIGAGGAGLRAAIEASAAGVKVGVLSKSLLGKAHTVMAEGGVAAALANVDDRDSWRVHFADTMRGGQYLNNWRMAELHAKEAPDRVHPFFLQRRRGDDQDAFQAHQASPHFTGIAVARIRPLLADRRLEVCQVVQPQVAPAESA